MVSPDQPAEAVREKTMILAGSPASRHPWWRTGAVWKLGGYGHPTLPFDHARTDGAES